MSVTAASLAANLIRVFEGCRLKAYKDPGGVLTIGFGHTKTAKQGMVITQQQADLLFATDCAPLLALVQGRPVIETAALVSFGFNCGAGALRRLLKRDIELSQYGKTSGGVQLPGLVARRGLEDALVKASQQTMATKGTL